MSTMNGTASGSELNVYSNIIKLSEINNEKELLKNVKDVHDGFDGYRECFPAELNFSDNKDTNISCKNSSASKSLLIPDKSNIIIGHYFIYDDASYIFNYKKNLKSLSAKISDFKGYKVFEEIKDKKNHIDLELQTTGSPNEEQTFFIYLDNNGKECFEAFDIYVLESNSSLLSQKDKEKKKKEVKSFTKEVYSNLKKQKKLS